MYLSIHIYIYIYIYIHTCIHIYIYIYTYELDPKWSGCLLTQRTRVNAYKL